jgi:dihydroorotate dehydrogenase (NAD+) catalytic subunit
MIHQIYQQGQQRPTNLKVLSLIITSCPASKSLLVRYPALAVLNYSPFKILRGGLSGPAIKPLTLRLVYELSQKLRIPIIGCGGIISGKDALDYLICGAKAFQIGTANLIDPRSAIKIIKELKDLSYGLCN